LVAKGREMRFSRNVEVTFGSGILWGPSPGSHFCPNLFSKKKPFF
jgi:hypothetical protein